MLVADRYELGEVIGTGGMSEVYAAEDTLLGRGVAVKVLRPEMARDASFRERFRREAQNAGRLNHPAIVAVYDTGEAQVRSANLPFIIMERVFGRTLREVLIAEGPMRPEEAARTLAPACAALAASHEAGIVHRDIKPANIMITNTGQVKVMDFGIARALDDSTSAMTQTSTVIGTAQYLSPEQARGKHADGRSDIYALGCVAYELVTGRPPFQGETPFSVAYQHVKEDPEPPSHFIPDLSATAAVNVDAVILTAMTKHPADRYQTAEEFRRDVELLGRNAVTQAARAHIRPARATENSTAQFAAAPVGTSDDDERYVDGQQAGETAAGSAGSARARGAEPTGHRKKGSGWARWVAAVLGVIVIAITGAFAFEYFRNSEGMFSASSNVTVPDVVGWERAEAERALEQAQLRVDINEEPSPEVPRGRVIRTNPRPGSTLQADTSVVVTVSSGREITDVPDLTGLSLSEAREILEKSGLELDSEVNEQNSETMPKDSIITQNPAVGSQISKGTRVSVTVSAGKPMVRVPNLVGMNAEEAQSTLDSVGLTADVQQEDSREPEGRVLSVSTAGEQMPHGSPVTISVSNGQLIAMPSITRMNRGQALRELRNAGWQGPDSALVEGDTVATANLLDQDNIAATSPQAGEDLRRDQTVEIRLWKLSAASLLPR